MARCLQAIVMLQGTASTASVEHLLHCPLEASCFPRTASEQSSQPIPHAIMISSGSCETQFTAFIVTALRLALSAFRLVINTVWADHNPEDSERVQITNSFQH